MPAEHTLPKAVLTTPERRGLAAGDLDTARRELLDAARHLDDGHNPTAHQSCMAAITAVDDTLAAIVHATQSDDEFERISEASRRMDVNTDRAWARANYSGCE